ncbi:aminotransferase class I and II [Apiospora arundinis]
MNSLKLAVPISRFRTATTPLRLIRHFHASRQLGFCSTMTNGLPSKLKPAARVTGQRQDVWSIINEAAAASPKQPIVNMGQGFFGYNPPNFIINAAKAALDKVDCNQYSPTKGRPRLKKAIADAYSPFGGGS